MLIFEKNKSPKRTAYTQYTISTILIPDQQIAQQISQRLKARRRISIIISNI